MTIAYNALNLTINAETPAFPASNMLKLVHLGTHCRGTPLRTPLPSVARLASERLASYWNAFFVRRIFDQILSVKASHVEKM